MTSLSTVTVGLVGYGYWGPNLARNFSRQPACRIKAICEVDEGRAEMARLHYPDSTVTSDYDVLLNDPDIDAILVATPVFSHHELSKKAILAGKDILVEKPLTSSVEEAEELVRLAEENGRVMGVDHTFIYTGAVQKLKGLMDGGELGDLVYLDTVRVNLGLFQPDVNVIWDLAPHDLSIFHYLVGERPAAVRAMGRCYGSEHESIGYVHIDYKDGLVAHCHFNWVSPVKLRRTIIAGSRRMAVFDDMEHSDKIKVYDKGVDIREDDWESQNGIRVDYRTGDMWAPKISMREALDAEAADFLDCVRTRKAPQVDGRFGLEVVRQLAACQTSVGQDGRPVEV